MLQPFVNIYSAILRKGLLSLVPGAPAEHTGTTGTLALRDLLIANSKMAECYIDCEMGHGLSSATNPVTGYLLSNFGTTINNELDLQVYIVQRAAVFFQSILLGATSIQGKNTFIECENTRYNTFATTCKSLGVIEVNTACGSCVNCDKIKVPQPYCPLPWE